MQEIQYDDLDALEALVSTEYGEWGEQFEVTQELIQRFAELTGDHQWIHVDEERAAAGPFGTTIAHGLLTLAVSSAARPRLNWKVVGQGNVVNYGSDGLRFIEPVPSGARIHSRARVSGVEKHRAGTRLALEIAVHVVGNERPSMIYKAVILHAAPRQ